MTPKNLSKLVWQSIRRNRSDFLFSSLGIVIGIGTLLFFTALGVGIKQTVLERIFMVRQIEIEPKSYQVGAFQSEGLFGAKKLDDALVERLSQLDGVSAVYPKMRLTFPTGAAGGKELIGNDIHAELVADGIPDAMITDEEVAGKLAFRDWERVSCSEDADCESAFTCGNEGYCVGKPCSPGAQRGTPDPVCGDLAYCDENVSACQMPIPVLISPQLLEIYNGSIHTALKGGSGAISKLPKLSQQALVGFGGDAIFGRSYFLGAAASGKRTERRRIQLVGFSSKAINLGVTMPIGYVKRLNATFGKEEDTKNYHAIIIETASNDAIASVAQRVEEMGYALSDKFENAQRASLLILLITLVFNLISAVILAVAAVNIMHTFLMMILERRHELGLMRALGATRGEIRALVLCEATVLGAFGGAVGAALGWLTTRAADALFASQVSDFPFKPDTLFVFEWWMFGLCLGAALLFCWIGALLPAIRASRVDPAKALTGH